MEKFKGKKCQICNEYQSIEIECNRISGICSGCGKIRPIDQITEEGYNRNDDLMGIWNFLPSESLPKKDKPVLIFRENHEPNVIGAFYEGNIEYGEFHNGEPGVNRVVYSGVTAWTDVLSAPYTDTDLTKDDDWFDYPY